MGRCRLLIMDIFPAWSSWWCVNTQLIPLIVTSITHQSSGDHDSLLLIPHSISKIYQGSALSKLLACCEVGFHGYLATVRKIEASIFKLVNQASRSDKKPVVEKLAQFRNTRHSLQHMVDKWGLLRKLLFKETHYFLVLFISQVYRSVIVEERC